MPRKSLKKDVKPDTLYNTSTFSTSLSSYLYMMGIEDIAVLSSKRNMFLNNGKIGAAEIFTIPNAEIIVSSEITTGNTNTCNGIKEVTLTIKVNNL